MNVDDGVLKAFLPRLHPAAYRRTIWWGGAGLDAMAGSATNLVFGVSARPP